MHRQSLLALLSHPLIVTIITILSIMSIFSLRNNTRSALISQKSLQQVEENLKLVEENYLAKQSQAALQQTPLAIEKIMRNELLKKRAEEIVLQIPEPNHSRAERNLPPPAVNGGPLHEWWQLLNF